MKRVRAGSGLGDSIYLRPVAEHLARSGAVVTALTDYPDVFLGANVLTEPFRRHQVDVVAHYVAGKPKAGTTQWQDVLESAGIAEDLPLTIPWTVRNGALVARMRTEAAGRPIVLVHGGRAPMARSDGFGMELLPTQESFAAVLRELGDCYRVQVGKAVQIYPLACDVSLNGSTTVADLIDLASIANGVVCQCSFAIPLAEALGKRLLAIWSARAFTARESFVRLTTPEKVLSGPLDSYVVDDWPVDRIREAAHALRRFH